MKSFVKTLFLTTIVLFEFLSLVNFVECVLDEATTEDITIDLDLDGASKQVIDLIDLKGLSKKEIKDIATEAVTEQFKEQLDKHLTAENVENYIKKVDAPLLFMRVTGYSVNQAILFLVLILTMPGLIVTLLTMFFCGVLKFGCKSGKQICCCCTKLVKTVTPL